MRQIILDTETTGLDPVTSAVIDQLMLRMKRDDWDAVIATNLTAAFALTQAVLKPMIRQRGGRIISISAAQTRVGYPNSTLYAATKVC